jgi:hypothetical protein
MTPTEATAANNLLQLEAATAARAVRNRTLIPSAPSSAAATPAASAAPVTEKMPANGRPFHYQSATATPALGTNDFPILSVRVPEGMQMVVKSVANGYIGAAFNEGSGDLIWRLAVDGAFSPGFDNITTSLGDFKQPRDIRGAIVARSGQLVEYRVSVVANVATAGTQVFATLDGWFAPSA